MTAVYFQNESLKVHTVSGYPFLLVEPMGNLQLEEYKQCLSEPAIVAAIAESKMQMVYLELNGIWTVGMDQQEWTVTEFQTRLKAAGVTKMAIGLAEHVYPMFVNLAASYEQKAVLPTKYFADLNSMTAFLR